MYITKGELWDLLGADALIFSGWLISADPQAAVLKNMLENTTGITLESTLVQKQLIPLLRIKNVITQETVDKINAYIVIDSSSFKTFSVLKPKDIINYSDWLKQYCNFSFEVQVGEVYLTVITKGNCEAPNTEKV